MDRQTDGWTDGQMDGQGDYYRTPLTSSGGALMSTLSGEAIFIFLPPHTTEVNF